MFDTDCLSILFFKDLIQALFGLDDGLRHIGECINFVNFRSGVKKLHNH